jgi:hypothetical protein
MEVIAPVESDPAGKPSIESGGTQSIDPPGDHLGPSG